MRSARMMKWRKGVGGGRAQNKRGEGGGGARGGTRGGAMEDKSYLVKWETRRGESKIEISASNQIKLRRIAEFKTNMDFNYYKFQLLNVLILIYIAV